MKDPKEADTLTNREPEIWKLKMAIGFARIKFVQRSKLKNACHKSAYNGRLRLAFEGNCVLSARTYDFSKHGEVAYNNILLPVGADPKFESPEVLWNTAEQKEKKVNSQTAMELVLALPDDKEISIEDRIEMSLSFVQREFIDKGLGSQISIHNPKKELRFTKDIESLGVKKGEIGEVLREKNGFYVVEVESEEDLPRIIQVDANAKEGFLLKEGNNWHAHVLSTTRRFKENGTELADHKARDILPVMRYGKVISGPKWGELWADHQNKFFMSKGLALRVDEKGIVPQEHLGPVRLRARAFSLLEEHKRRVELNFLAAENPKNILEAITEKRSVFTKADVERFMSKHVLSHRMSEAISQFWDQAGIVRLIDHETKTPLDRFTSKTVIEEEQKILRLADSIYRLDLHSVSEKSAKKFSSGLSPEQSLAYSGVLNGKGLSCIQGYAGTGKSQVLSSLKNTYEDAGFCVRAFGPDNATAKVLQEKGFSKAENIYQFLFSVEKGGRPIQGGKEIWLLDEAGKLGNKPFLEFLKLAASKKAKVILAGDSAQLPSIERGGVFKTFCSRYGSKVLMEVKRQKDENDRAMAKELATGKMGAGLDRLSESGGIRWSATRKEAMEELVLKWAQDHRKGVPGGGSSASSSLIIAQTNAEVRTFGEMIRLIRRQRGELGTQEFACDTAFGKIYVSEGDLLEFRKNCQETNVSNGLVGVLVEAKEDKFRVVIREEGRGGRTVTFNPQEYHSFQLGYASTCSRSQGRTVEKAYVMHSPYLNKQMAYVELTRHIKQVEYFVAREEVANLADLKRQAFRDGSKNTTLEYTNAIEIASLSKEDDRAKEIQSLKLADKQSLRLKGMALEAWDLAKSTTGGLLERIQDKRPDKEFFNPSIQKDNSLASVKAISREEMLMLMESGDKTALNNVIEKISSQDRRVEQQENVIYQEQVSWGLDQELKKEGVFTAHKTEPAQKKEEIAAYYAMASAAAGLRDLVEAEKASGIVDSTAVLHIKEWQKVCAQRNEAAFNVMQRFSKEELTESVSEKSVYFITVQAKRHEEFLENQNRRPSTNSIDIDAELRAHIHPLIYKLFPDGPVSKTATEFRFGSKGSLAIVHNGNKAGDFFDFERQEGGGPLKLVQRELNFDYQDSKTWALDFLGVASTIEVPKAFSKPTHLSVKEKLGWSNLKNNEHTPAPSLEELGKLSHRFTETMRHAYRDSEGNLLYYVLRLQDKADPTRKITPPLSYGRFADEDSLSWQLKGYKSENGKNPLYNLHLLAQHPEKTVLIVEGEKTADKAIEKFPGKDFVCVTWPGGSGAVSKADWAPLSGREIIVWPDNDEAGIKAGRDICAHLRDVGVQSLEMIPQNQLKEKFPEKWDLADPLPNGMTEKTFKNVLLSRIDEDIDFAKILPQGADEIMKARATEIWGALDQKVKRNFEGPEVIKRGEIKLELAKQVSGKLAKIESLSKQLERGEPTHAKGELAKQIAYHAILYECFNGSRATESNIQDIKETVVRINQASAQVKLDGSDKGALTIGIDKTISRFLSENLFAGVEKQGKWDALGKDAANQGKEISMSIDVSGKNSGLFVQKQVGKATVKER